MSAFESILGLAPQYAVAFYFAGTALNLTLKVFGFGDTPLSKFLDRTTLALEGIVGQKAALPPSSGKS